VLSISVPSSWHKSARGVSDDCFRLFQEIRFGSEAIAFVEEFQRELFNGLKRDTAREESRTDENDPKGNAPE
jgi:hypothetical protein